MQEIVPDIFTWHWFSEPHGYDFNGYLVRRPEGSLCIDPVPPGDDGLAEIARMQVSTILITNRNHSRAANAVRERTGARVLIHPDDAPHARSQGTLVDGELQPGTSIGPLRAVAAPGKSPGEVALHWPERRLLFVGMTRARSRLYLTYAAQRARRGAIAGGGGPSPFLAGIGPEFLRRPQAPRPRRADAQQLRLL